jgi:hypothetical protein
MDDAQVGSTTKGKVKEKIDGMSDEKLASYDKILRRRLEQELRPVGNELIKEMTESIDHILNLREAISDLQQIRLLARVPRATSSGTHAPSTRTTSGELWNSMH